MLTSEALAEQARLRGMPTNKMRSILREYLQILILKELYKTSAGKKLYFTGGTYLRLVHNLKRFSEDLDFNACDISQAAFEQLVEKISVELQRTGVASKVTFAHWGDLFVAKMHFMDIEKQYAIYSPHTNKSGIIIKIESRIPEWEIKQDTQVISGFGQMFPGRCTDKSILFTEKIDALIKKNRARHLYDIMFMLVNKFPVDIELLKHYAIALSPIAAMRERVRSLSEEELKHYADSLRPFLFEEHEAEMLEQAHTCFPPLLENYATFLENH